MARNIKSIFKEGVLGIVFLSIFFSVNLVFYISFLSIFISSEATLKCPSVRMSGFKGNNFFGADSPHT